LIKARHHLRSREIKKRAQIVREARILGGYLHSYALRINGHNPANFGVGVVFLLLLPEPSNGFQPNALACVARAFRDVEMLRRLRSAPDGEVAFRVFTGDVGATG
jgi:hypothetical protein